MAETIAEEISDIAETTYEVDVEERLRVLEEREKAVELLVKARYLQCWRNQHAGRSTLLGLTVGLRSQVVTSKHPKLRLMEELFYSRISEFTFTPCVGSFTSPGIDTRQKGPPAFSVSSERRTKLWGDETA